ncbi:TPA: caspase family protein, partial [Pasteurella multocida]|nr:caspase family protein [Pasteurella multocida]
ALLIGNANGLSGVQKDLLDFKNFLLSNKGGAWYDSEIVMISKSDINTVRSEIQKIKSSSPDYVITFFSGHGAYKRGTILELADEEIINESELFHLADRQLSIFDCCRNKVETIARCSAVMESYDFSKSSKTYVRAIYDQRILQAVIQQIRLYSCSINESSYDTNQGGVYFQNLLNVAKSFESDIKENRVSLCHQKAKRLTENANVTEGKQHPEAILPKCLSSQELILSINY